MAECSSLFRATLAKCNGVAIADSFALWQHGPMVTRETPLVLQLQAGALDRSVRVSDLLTRAKIVAHKLNTAEALTWITRELNGYTDVSANDLPTYRKLHGQPEFLNPYSSWLPIIFDDEELYSICSSAFIFQSIGTLEQLVKDGAASALHVRHTAKVTSFLIKRLGLDTQTVVSLPKALVWEIVDKVRDLVVDWTLDLERAGVRGEGMTFTMNEKNTATSVTNNYFAQNIGVAGNVSDRSSIRNRQVATANSIDLGAVQNLAKQLRNGAGLLPPDTQQAVAAPLKELDEELTSSSPDRSKIAGLLSMIQAALVGATGNLIASGALQGISALLGS